VDEGNGKEGGGAREPCIATSSVFEVRAVVQRLGRDRNWRDRLRKLDGISSRQSGLSKGSEMTQRGVPENMLTGSEGTSGF